MERIITHREMIDKTPTLDDKIKGVGVKGFVRKLEEDGLINIKKKIILKRFVVIYNNHAEKGNNYVEWSAIPID